MKGEEEALYTSESRSNNRPPTKRGYSGVTKEEATKELHNPRELRRTITRVSKERDFEVFAIIAGKWSHAQGLFVQEKVY